MNKIMYDVNVIYKLGDNEDITRIISPCETLEEAEVKKLRFIELGKNDKDFLRVDIDKIIIEEMKENE